MAKRYARLVGDVGRVLSDPAGTRVEREGLWDWNLVTNRVHFSPRWISLVGCDEHEIGHVPDSWLNRIHPEDRDRVTRELETLRHDEQRSELDVPHRLRHKNGTYRWMSCRALVERNQAGQAIRLTGRHADVTAEEVTDPVTGLPNHKLLVDRLTLALDRAHRQPAFQFGLLLIDLGQSPDGEAAPPDDVHLLTAAARRLETCLRAPDTDFGIPHNDLVARWDGDRFAVLLEGLRDVGHAKVIGDRLLAELLAPFSQGGDQVFVVASIGIAVSGTAYHSAEDVIRDADTARHRARMLGGSKCEIFDTAILKSEESQAGLDVALKAALDRGEFRLVYQPIMSLASNQIVGFEALVRWQHPVRGRVSPQEFIPLAEKTGFIVPLGRWIVREACTQLKRWQGTPSVDCWVSVNLSAEQLKLPTLVDDISEALNDSDLEARCLTLEITESMAMENPIAVKTLLMRLRALGVRISIDDFGTGYSSLAHLRQFPVDTLKVDRSFIRGIETDTDTSTIVGALIAMAQQLGLHVVVEGVESDGQLALLRSLQCDAVQGYLFANPLDADGVATVLAKGLTVETGPTAGEAMRTSRGSRSRLLKNLSAPAQWAVAAAIVLMMAGATWASRLPKPESSLPALPPAPVLALRGTNTAAKEAVPQADPLPEAASLRVVHLHQFGGCTGRIMVGREGLKFTPEKHAKDAFALPYGEFVHSIAGDTLTVRSASKTYRFKTAAVSKNDKGSQLRNFATNITRLRPATAF
jgi:diguanylate cyclase (GGDEF)-like protein